MAYLSVPKISRHLTFLHLSSPLIVDNCFHIANLSFAITYLISLILLRTLFHQALILFLHIQEVLPMQTLLAVGCKVCSISDILIPPYDEITYHILPEYHCIHLYNNQAHLSSHQLDQVLDQ